MIYGYRMTELCFESATELGRRLKAREVSAVEVLEAHLRQIERINPSVNAIVTLDEAGARARARELDALGMPKGPLHGLPVAIKDLELTRGMRTTFGSPIYRDYIPDADALHVTRLRDAGAVVIGKTNTPEFGAGSQTFNAIFGRTRNPYNLEKTCGGSSGGAAVAAACGMVSLADGSDLGGSLRNPPSFCNVVGLRPSPGRIPRWPGVVDPWSPLDVVGPIARSVDDAALLLSVLAGPDPRAPLALDAPGETFRQLRERDWRGVRIAWSRDLGSFPVDERVIAVFDRAIECFSELGCELEPAHPDFRNAPETFQTLRAHGFAMAHASHLERHRSLLKDTVVWNIEKGLALTGAEISRAQRERGELYERVRRFMESYEFLLMPVTQVPPFDIEIEWVDEIEGVAMDSYVDWMKSCYFITLTALPAMSIPAGFTDDGLPVGLQIVGRYRDERSVLELGRAFERATRVGERRPELR
jgi:amidase